MAPSLTIPSPIPPTARLLWCLACSAAMVGCSDAPTPREGGTERVRLGEREFDLTLAMTPESRTKGLGGVEEVPATGGMMFVFQEPSIHGFWMYGCLTDIDIAFVDPIGYVTAVHTMPAEPARGDSESDLAYRRRLPKYSSRYPAQFAIELAPGMFESLGIEAGDRIPIPVERLKVLGQASEPDF